MRYSTRVVSFLFSRLFAFVTLAALCSIPVAAQQTLGGITGEVTDASGGVIPNVSITVVDESTSLTRTTTTSGSGTYALVNLPIGTYTLTYKADGYDLQRTQHITVQANRTATVNAALKVGQTTTTVEVEASPLMNAVDTTVGYVLDKTEIESVPLATGSFTGLATQSSGVSAEFGGGTGANSGLGNAPIWANGQRDTSNSFLLNGVDASNLFNGKSTSQVTSSRVINSTGVQTSPGGGGGEIPSAASVYLSIGNAIPTPAPETIAEVRVNASMYDATQGSTSGAHIDLSTASGTNNYHGSLYGHRGTQLDQRRALLLQPGSQRSRERQGSRVASLHPRWHARRRNRQGQALRISLATSTCTCQTRRSAIRSSMYPSASATTAPRAPSQT